MKKLTHAESSREALGASIVSLGPARGCPVFMLAALACASACSIEEHPGWVDGLSASTQSSSLGDTLADGETDSGAGGTVDMWRL